MALFKVIKSLAAPYRWLFRTVEGSATTPYDAIEIKSDTDPTGILIRRVDSAGVIQDDDQPSPFASNLQFNLYDQIHVKYDFSKITTLKMPNNYLRDFNVYLSDDLPNIRHFDITNNDASITTKIDQCKDLEVLKVADNRFGIFSNLYPVPSKLRHIEVGRTSASKPDYGTLNMYRLLKHLKDDNTVNNGVLYSDYATNTNDVNTHEHMVNVRGWDIGLMTISPGSMGMIAGGNTTSIKIMSSKYDTKVYTDGSTWLTLGATGTTKSNTIVPVDVTATANNTGATRTATIYVDKLYADGTAFPVEVNQQIQVTQDPI